jgi:hypothetical protein
MNNEKRKLIENLMFKSITQEKFLKSFNIEIELMPKYINELLHVAYIEKNADDVELLLYVGFVFKLFSKDFVGDLCEILEESWHNQHENIARLLQSLESPEAIESLYKAALTRFEYLDYDEAFALAVKCIWAIWAINTPESHKKLELLSRVDNEIIRKCAQERLADRKS